MVVVVVPGDCVVVLADVVAVGVVPVVVEVVPLVDVDVLVVEVVDVGSVVEVVPPVVVVVPDVESVVGSGVVVADAPSPSSLPSSLPPPSLSSSWLRCGSDPTLTQRRAVRYGSSDGAPL